MKISKINKKSIKNKNANQKKFQKKNSLNLFFVNLT